MSMTTFDATQVQAWVHNLDPFIFELWQGVGLRWYGTAYLMGFIAGALLMRFFARRGRRTLPEEQVLDFITYVVLGTMIGGRLGYAIFYDPSLLVSWNAEIHLFGVTVPVWNLLAVWEGGMASHGGIAGIMVASWLYARKANLSWLHLGDLTTLGGALGIFFGRIANFINGELMGRPVQSAISWAVKFPQDMYRWGSGEIERLRQIAPAAAEVGVTADSWNQWLNQFSTSRAARDQVRQTVDQVVHALQAGNQKIAEVLQPVLEARHASQLYQGLMEGLLVFVVCFLLWRKPRKPGVIGAVFLTLYAVMRIIGEQFRMPDAHIGYQIFGLTRGQVISIGMLIAAAIFLLWTLRRQTEVIAGWGPEAQALKAAEKN